MGLGLDTATAAETIEQRAWAHRHMVE